MSFSVGDDVVLIPLRKNGTVTKVLKQGWYRVQTGSVAAKVRESDLKLKKKDKKAKKRKPTRSTTKLVNPSAVSPLDLHGLRVSEAIARTENYLSDAIIAGAEKVEIVHGIGTGALKKAIHLYLGNVSVVKHFKLHATNSGTTIVYL